MMTAEKIDELTKKYLPSEEGLTGNIARAMNYSMTVGGKRLRPMMMYEAYKCFGGDNEELIEHFMAAIEMIHNYSLCHDDLPSLDNDDYRRGSLTTHKKFGEAMGILAGDGLQTQAFLVASQAMEYSDRYDLIVRAINVLALKSGIDGMLGGQAVDVESAEKNIDLYAVTFIDRGKTAALIQAAFMIGAILADASEDNIRLMEALGDDIGVAFQIQDDILDVTGSFEETGKTAGNDDMNNKTTYVSLVGLDESRQELENLFGAAREKLQKLGERADGIHRILDMLIGRNR